MARLMASGIQAPLTMAPLKTMSAQAFRTEYQYGDRSLTVSRGCPLPTGTSLMPNGVNFALICRHGTAVWLVLSEPCEGEVVAEIPLHDLYNRTGDHWHIRVDGLPEEFCYGYRVDGPRDDGHRFDPSKILLDPYSRALSCGRPWGLSGGLPRRSLMNESMIERGGVVNPRIPLEDTIIYELHVRGYTIDASSGVRHPGTYAGLTEKIDYLKWLGITAVELLPVDEFDENDCPFVNPLTGERLKNYWGYNPISFGAPKAAYALNPERSEPWDEFCGMVSAFHRRGIEVILDIVFNHTAEGREDGPTYNFRGLDNSLYYMLDSRGQYLNFSGCGNTFNSDHPVVRNYIVACLRNWVSEAGVDGFRFDLASVLGRDRRGNVLVNPPAVNRISEDSLLYGTKLIAEPWDAGGLYQVGTFPGGARWTDWNGRYRDDVRRFWRGEPGMTSALATRLCGSDDLYGGRGPLHSINFLCCHDGFTLYDLVSYNQKHNEANGEGNRDGNDANLSWNCGAEGLDIRPHREPTPRAAGAQPDGDPAGLSGRSHDPRGRRVPSHPEGKQQRLVSGQQHKLGRLDLEGSQCRLPAFHPEDDRLAEGAPFPPPPDLLHRGRTGRPPGDSLAWRRTGPPGFLVDQPGPGVHPRWTMLRSPGNRGSRPLCSHE